MTGMLDADPMCEWAFDRCAAIIRAKAHSFYFAARFLPAARRRDVYALYAFCRTVDDLADVPGAGTRAGSVEAELEQWRSWLLAGAPAERADPVKYALAHVVSAHDLPLDHLVELVDAVCADLQPRHLPDFAALDRYCHGVAGTVGMVMAALLGARDAAALDHARDLGIAMQLTNVLRDVGEDLARGRIYLPADEMSAHGYSPADLERAVIDARFVALVRAHIARARDYYARGLDGVCYLPPDAQFPIAVAARTYAAILGKIERAGYDVFAQRARTRRRDKLLLAAQLYAHQWRGGSVPLGA